MGKSHEKLGAGLERQRIYSLSLAAADCHHSGSCGFNHFQPTPWYEGRRISITATTKVAAKEIANTHGHERRSKEIVPTAIPGRSPG